MSILTQNTRYLPHDLNTKFYSCKLYASKQYSVKTVLRKYHISKASLMRWMKVYDGTKESLIAKSKTPHTPHKNRHTDIEIYNIKNLLRRNPNIGLSELYGKLKREYAYTRHPASLFIFLRKHGIYTIPEYIKTPYKPKPYDTPKDIGVKMQLDVKYVPKQCYTSKKHDRFYQYTIIDEASRERFIYAYNEHSSHSTNDFVLRSIIYFGYIPKTIQTDNGFEFTHNKETKKEHPFDTLCKILNIEHKLIRPRTPRHNGKVERSHRNDNARFYSTLNFYSLNDLQIQMKNYLKRSNNIPSSSLNWLTPYETRTRKTNLIKNNRFILNKYQSNEFLFKYNI